MKRWFARHKITWYQVVGLTASILLMIIGIIFPNFRPSDGILAGFLVAVTALLLTEIISRDGEEEHVEQMSEDARTHLHVVPIGTPIEAWEYVLNRLPDLDDVRNTSFNTEDELEESETRFYKRANYKSLGERLAGLEQTDFSWKEVGDSFAENRFKATDLEVNDAARYDFKIIDKVKGETEPATPQMSFILLRDQRGKTEVLFNWDFREGAEDPIVLLSRDAPIVHMFSEQFRRLWDVGTPLRES